MLLDERSGNPRYQCHVCGKWRRTFLKDGKQTVYGGDSDCGDVCVYCIDKLTEGKVHKNMNPINCPKCNKK